MEQRQRQLRPSVRKNSYIYVYFHVWHKVPENYTEYERIQAGQFNRNTAIIQQVGYVSAVQLCKKWSLEDCKFRSCQCHPLPGAQGCKNWHWREGLCSLCPVNDSNTSQSVSLRIGRGHFHVCYSGIACLGRKKSGQLIFTLPDSYSSCHVAGENRLEGGINE